MSACSSGFFFSLFPITLALHWQIYFMLPIRCASIFGSTGIAVALSIEYVQGSTLRAICVYHDGTLKVTARRCHPSPEQLLPAYEASSQWYGIGVPCNTPIEIVYTLNQAIRL